jgi:hypothetical protein
MSGTIALPVLKTDPSRTAGTASTASISQAADVCFGVCIGFVSGSHAAFRLLNRRATRAGDMSLPVGKGEPAAAQPLPGVPPEPGTATTTLPCQHHSLYWSSCVIPQLLMQPPTTRTVRALIFVQLAGSPSASPPGSPERSRPTASALGGVALPPRTPAATAVAESGIYATSISHTTATSRLALAIYQHSGR